ncbi:hypothetical protein AA0242T_2272 [Acetobacter aceti NRIC 0242]|nr:hypothetical protein AA0242T_2272 [Acetobacter aceti NRIC 0242]
MAERAALPCDRKGHVEQSFRQIEACHKAMRYKDGCEICKEEVTANAKKQELFAPFNEGCGRRHEKGYISML